MTDPLTAEEEAEVRDRMDVWSDYGPDPTETILRLLATLDRDRSTPSVDGLRLSTVDFALAEAHVARAKRDRVMTTLRAALAATREPTYHYSAVIDPQTGKLKPAMPVDMVADFAATPTPAPEQ